MDIFNCRINSPRSKTISRQHFGNTSSREVPILILLGRLKSAKTARFRRVAHFLIDCHSGGRPECSGSFVDSANTHNIKDSWWGCLFLLVPTPLKGKECFNFRNVHSTHPPAPACKNAFRISMASGQAGPPEEGEVVARLSQNLSSPPACRENWCVTNSGRSVSVGDPFGIVNFQSGFPPGTRLPARMHFTLQWPVGRQAGMTNMFSFETASPEEGKYLGESSSTIQRYHLNNFTLICSAINDIFHVMNLFSSSGFIQFTNFELFPIYLGNDCWLWYLI